MLETQNLRVRRTERLDPPSALKDELPGTDAAYEVVVRGRAKQARL